MPLPAVLVHGNCQSLPMVQMLRRMSWFSRFEVLQVRWIDMEQHRPERFLPELSPERAVLLVHAVEREPGVPGWLLAGLPAGVPVVRVAALETRVAWPFFCRDPRNVPEPGFAWGRRPYGDTVLIGLRDQGLRGEALFRAYMDRSVEVVRAGMEEWLAAEERRLAAQDAVVEVSGSDLMGEAARRRAFHTPNHPAGWLLRRMGARVARAVAMRLGVAGGDADAVLERQLPKWEPLGAEELPVHPAVAKRLGMEWWQPGITYRTPHGEVNFRRYMRGYAADYA